MAHVSSSIRAKYLWPTLQDVTASGHYEYVNVRVVLRKESGGVKLCYGRLDLGNHKYTPESNSYDLGNLILVQQIVAFSVLRGLIRQLSQGTMTLGEYKFTVHDGENTLVDYDFVPSGSSWSQVEVDRPTTVYLIRSSDSGQIPNENLRSIGEFPYFPTTFEAMMTFLDLTSYAYSPGFMITVSETNAWIEDLAIIGKDLDVTIAGDKPDDPDLVCKFYTSRGVKREYSEPIKIDKRHARYTMSTESDTIDAALISKSTGRVIDRKSMRGLFPTQKGITIKTPENFVNSLIVQKEGRTLEFKVTNDETVIDTVVSFSNTEGGTIIIGVTDARLVRGINDDPEKTEKSLRGRIRSLCEPAIDPRIEWFSSDGKDLMVVKVEEGKDKPYIHASKGILVREFESDRQITRSELEEIFRMKSRS